MIMLLSRMIYQTVERKMNEVDNVTVQGVFAQPTDASLVSVGIQVAPDARSSNNTPELPMVCAVVDMNASEYSVNPGECESKDKLDAEDCGGLMNDMSCGNVEYVTLSDKPVSYTHLTLPTIYSV